MSTIRKLAISSLKEIQDAENALATLQPKKQWIEKIKKDPKGSEDHYFEVFDNLVKNKGINDRDWEKLAILLHFGVDPLSAKNKDGLNSFEYFYQRNREERLSLHTPAKKHEYLDHQYEHFFETTANRLYNEFKDMGYTDGQLAPMQKTRDLWHNYQTLMVKETNTRRVAFTRLLKTVMSHPEGAVSAETFEEMVKARLKQEEKDEEKAWDKWRKWEKKDYHARFHMPSVGHARGHSPFGGLSPLFGGWKKHLLYQPLPDSSQKALDDFLMSLKDEDAYRGLDIARILPRRRVMAYRRALNMPKRFERTR